MHPSIYLHARRYQGIGLKGPVGAWAKENYFDNPKINRVK
jgi:hypothetical protein